MVAKKIMNLTPPPTSASLVAKWESALGGLQNVREYLEEVLWLRRGAAEVMKEMQPIRSIGSFFFEK